MLLPLLAVTAIVAVALAHNGGPDPRSAAQPAVPAARPGGFDARRAYTLAARQVRAGQRPAGSPQLRKLAEQLRPLRENALDGHPWRDWASFQEAETERRMPGATSRWNRGKDLSWVPIRLELVCEVAYDHMQGTRFRHAGKFKRWRPDKPVPECRYDQLEVTPPFELAEIFG